MKPNNPQIDNQIYNVEINTLKEYPNNARIGNTVAISESLKTNGQYRPIVVRKETNEILAGNHTWKAAKVLNWKTIKVTYVENITDEQATKIVLADNRYNEIGGYDSKKLVELLTSIEDLTGTGYDAEYMIELEKSLLPDAPIQLTDPEETPEPEPEKVTSKMGDVWLLGEHRLIVGDATKPEDYQKLTNGIKVDCIITDPPYNVNYEGGTGLKIKNDHMSDSNFNIFLDKAFTEMLENTKLGGPIYVFHADGSGNSFRNSFIKSGWLLKQVLIWVKNTIVLSRQDYHWQHEPILYGWKPGAAHPYVQDRTQSTVIDDQPKFADMKKEELIEYLANLYEKSTILRENKPARNAEHPTMKPVSLIKRLIENSSNIGDIILDPFAGSGSTLIAAYGLNRKAYLIEYDPVYADVICKRFQAHTGLLPVLESTGQPHDFKVGETK